MSDGTQGVFGRRGPDDHLSRRHQARGQVDLALPPAAHNGGATSVPAPARVRGLHRRALPGAAHDHHGATGDNPAAGHHPAAGHDAATTRHHPATWHITTDDRAVKMADGKWQGYFVPPQGGERTRCGAAGRGYQTPNGGRPAAAPLGVNQPPPRRVLPPPGRENESRAAIYPSSLPASVCSSISSVAPPQSHRVLGRIGLLGRHGLPAATGSSSRHGLLGRHGLLRAATGSSAVTSSVASGSPAASGSGSSIAPGALFSS